MTATQKTSAPRYDPVAVDRLFGFPINEVRPEPIPGFVTFYDPGWSIRRLRAAVANKGPIFYPQDWYDTKPFATFDEPPRYRQLRMTAVPNSFDRTFAEQQTLLPADEEIPSARVIVMGMVIHFLATGDRLFPDRFVHCIDKDSDGGRVDVGYFDAGGLHVHYFWDDDRDSHLGLSAARKS